MKCKILYNFFHDEEDDSFVDFELDLTSVNGFYIIENSIVVIISGTEYSLLFETELHKELQREFAKRKMYNLN